MLAVTRERLLGHLLEVPDLVACYERHDPLFPEATTAWLTAVVATLEQLRSPLTAAVSAAKGRIVATRDGLRDSRIEPRRSSHRMERVAAMLVIEDVEQRLRKEVATIDDRFAAARDQIAQLLGVASAQQPVEVPADRTRAEWIPMLWDRLGDHDGTRQMHAYLSGSLALTDRHYLLGEVLDNLLAHPADIRARFSTALAVLAEHGIRTAPQLLAAGARPAGRCELATVLDVPEAVVLRWVNLADLMRISGVGIETADVLESAGVDTIKELARRDPDRLRTALEEARDLDALDIRLPSRVTLTRWIEEAADLDPAIEY